MHFNGAVFLAVSNGLSIKCLLTSLGDLLQSSMIQNLPEKLSITHRNMYEIKYNI